MFLRSLLVRILHQTVRLSRNSTAKPRRKPARKAAAEPTTGSEHGMISASPDPGLWSQNMLSEARLEPFNRVLNRD